MSGSLSPTDVILHPVRLRIVQAFLGERELTTGELRAELQDVPTATLYRQVAAMVDGDVLQVVDEKRVRGAVERTYRLRTGAAHVDADTARSMSPDEHRRAFLTFVAGMLDNLDRYLDSSPEPDLARDGAGYALSALHLDEAELEEFLGELRAVIEPRRANGPREGRRRRIFSTVVMPEVPKS